jgi:hypothetical protein
MSTPRPARLYQKKSGFFFVRVLLATTSASRKDSAKRKELRCTLRTKSRFLARTVSSYLNALLEHVPVQERESAVTNFISHTVSAWTLPGGISASDDDDQERLLRFLAAKPALEQALVTYLQNLSGQPGAKLETLLATLALGRGSDAAPPMPLAASASTPGRTMRLKLAVETYLKRYNQRLETQDDRTRKMPN